MIRSIWRALGREGGLSMSGKMDKSAIGGLIENVKRFAWADENGAPFDLNNQRGWDELVVGGSRDRVEP